MIVLCCWYLSINPKGNVKNTYKKKKNKKKKTNKNQQKSKTKQKNNNMYIQKNNKIKMCQGQKKNYETYHKNSPTTEKITY